MKERDLSRILKVKQRKKIEVTGSSPAIDKTEIKLHLLIHLIFKYRF